VAGSKAEALGGAELVQLASARRNQTSCMALACQLARPTQHVSRANREGQRGQWGIHIRWVGRGRLAHLMQLHCPLRLQALQHQRQHLQQRVLSRPSSMHTLWRVTRTTKRPSIPQPARASQPPLRPTPTSCENFASPGHGSSCRVHAALRREAQPTGFTERLRRLRTGPGCEARSYT